MAHLPRSGREAQTDGGALTPIRRQAKNPFCSELVQKAIVTGSDLRALAGKKLDNRRKSAALPSSQGIRKYLT
jgi:hypothetical protein